MASRSMIAWQNYVRTGSLFSFSEAVGFPVSNLKIDIGDPSLGWQTVNGVITASAGAKFSVTSVNSIWRAIGLFRTNLTSSASVTFTLRTGSDPGATASITALTVPGPFPRYRSVVGIFPEDTTADSCLIEIDDGNNPDGHINVPLCYAGPVWNFLSPPTWNTKWGRDARIDTQTAIGGQEWAVARWQRRRCELDITGTRGSEAFSQLDVLDGDCRDSRNVLFVPDFASATMSQEAIYGMLVPTADIGYPYAGADRRSWAARITERL